MNDDDVRSDDELTPPLREALVALREEPPVPELWRARVLEQVQHTGAARRRGQRAMVAATIVLCAVLGAAIMRGRMHRAAAASFVASTPPSAGRLIASTPVRFTLVAPGARSVALVGAFDGWTPQGRPMRRALDGRTWEIELPLPPGRHAFAFMVDGALRVDPAAARAVEDDFGVPTSVIVVANRGT